MSHIQDYLKGNRMSPGTKKVQELYKLYYLHTMEMLMVSMFMDMLLEKPAKE